MTKEDLKKGVTQLISVVMTAAVAAGFAFIQGMIQQHGIPCGPVIDPLNAAAVGTGIKLTYAVGKASILV